jgi:ribonuclease P/MRP protein subunit POP5
MTNVCMIRVGRERCRIAWGAITLITTLEGERFIPHVIHGDQILNERGRSSG